MTPAISNEHIVQIIQQRLLTKTSTIGKTSLNKITDGIFQILNNKYKNEAEYEKLMDLIQWEVEEITMETEMNQLFSYTCQNELKAYDHADQDIDIAIEKTLVEIEKLKNISKIEKIIKHHKEEYESLSSVINENPPRKKLEEDLRNAEKEHEEAMRAAEEIRNKVDERSKQFSLLVRTIKDLKCIFKEDEEREEEMKKSNRTIGEDEDDDDDEEEEGEVQIQVIEKNQNDDGDGDRMVDDDTMYNSQLSKRQMTSERDSDMTDDSNENQTNVEENDAINDRGKGLNIEDSHPSKEQEDQSSNATSSEKGNNAQL